MTKKIKVLENTEPVKVPVRQYRVRGPSTDTISMSIPKELNQTINGMLVKTNKSRSLLLTELIEKGLKHE